MHGFRQRAENNASFFELVLKGGDHRYTVEYRIDRDACQHLLFQQRNAELVIGLQQLGVHLIQRLGPILGFLGCAVVTDFLVVNRRDVEMRPVRRIHGEPMSISL